MKNIGKPCEGTLYTIPDQGVVVDAIKVVSEPKNGTISIKAPKFFYTAHAGFSGRDRFELSAEGPDREKGQRIKLKGEVTVQVNPL
ncbi:MAG: Ig-like domain-containing protein [bacterium]